MVDEKVKVEAEIEQEPRQGSGSLLAAARKQQNKTVLEIAEELNLSVTQIKTIELDQTDGLPEPTYVRGYIRSYAKLLGLNAEDVLKNYLNPNWQQGTNLDDIPRGIGNADELDDKGFFTPTRVSLIVVVLAGFMYLWYSGLLAELIGGKPASEQVQSTESSEDVAGDYDTALDDDASGAGGEAASSGLDENKLNLTFGQASWVDIRDAEDNKLAYRTHAEGESLEVASAGSMHVFIGNASGVTVTYNGAPFDTTPHVEGVYAKFTVGGE